MAHSRGQLTGPSATCSGVTRLWMHRVDGWAKPSTNQKNSSNLFEEFDELREVRVKTNTGIFEWAERVQDRRLQADQVWFSVSVGREMRYTARYPSCAFLQPSNPSSGQAHAMITAAGNNPAMRT